MCNDQDERRWSMAKAKELIDWGEEGNGGKTLFICTLCHPSAVASHRIQKSNRLLSNDWTMTLSRPKHGDSLHIF